MPPPTKNHYEVLGVPTGSSHEEIRRAYHDQARRWHPDRFQEKPAAEAEQAEISMRHVNEAWRVLSDQQRRTTYDYSLSGPVQSPRPGVQTSADGITRIDPRLLDPEFLAARRRSQVDAVEYKNSWMLRVLPMVAFVALLAGIVVFTAYARTPGTAITTTTFRGPEIGIDPGACVRRLPDAGLLQLPCDGNEDGVLIAVAMPGAACPEGTKLSQPVREGMTACLG